MSSEASWAGFVGEDRDQEPSSGQKDQTSLFTMVPKDKARMNGQKLEGG